MASQQLYFEDMRAGIAIPALVKRPTTVQLFRFSAMTWNAHRIHFDHDYALSEGYPGVLVQSHMHGSFLAEAAMKWAGPAARITALRWQNRASAIPGDTLTVTGVVSRTELREGVGLVECELEERNQNNQLCAPGWVRLVLPRRKEGCDGSRD